MSERFATEDDAKIIREMIWHEDNVLNTDLAGARR